MPCGTVLRMDLVAAQTAKTTIDTAPQPYDLRSV